MLPFVVTKVQYLFEKCYQKHLFRFKEVYMSELMIREHNKKLEPSSET